MGGRFDGGRLAAAPGGYLGRIDRDGDVTITPYRDGPLLVRGSFTLRDQSGNEIRNERATVALCRCGKSRTRPFCDGSHKLVDFRAPSGREHGRDSG